MTAPPAEPSILDWVGVALVCGSAALAALIELFLVPLYAGSVLVPVAILLAVAGNVLLPRMGRALVPKALAAVLPFVAWLIVVVAVGFFTRPEGDVVLPGGGGAEWVGLGVALGGALAGTVTIVMSTPPPGTAPRRGTVSR
ncbi:MAG TPA: hypothetical protein VGN35_11570 [Jatrophihabitantaceae bacterium]|jgi:hypothetical protein|nr:hypothetical protein [Jatrophihabitantaceae bacterium]